MGKQLKKATHWRLGLDLGTASVGYAATNENGEMLYYGKNPVMGSRIFREAETAEATRMSRGQRRRIIRRRRRLDLLQGMFQDEIDAIDPGFFARLRQSQLLPSDKHGLAINTSHVLFDGSPTEESEDARRFPTIFHRRAWLTETGEKADIRSIYLAISHIVKYRGNFLHEGESISTENTGSTETYGAFAETLGEWLEAYGYHADIDNNAICAALSDEYRGISDMQAGITTAIGTPAKELKPAVTNIAKALAGGKADLSKVFTNAGNAPQGADAKMSLADDEKVEQYAESLEDEDAALFEAMRKAYASTILARIIGQQSDEPLSTGILEGSTGKTISYAMVRSYEQYGRDLALLKRLVREYAPDSYGWFFRGKKYGKRYSTNKGEVFGYTRYDSIRKTDIKELAKDITKVLGKTPAADLPEYGNMMERIADGKFLHRQKTFDNGTIPYQLHLEELNAILERQGRFYPFLLESRDKIESLVTMRIPYYVGPMTQRNAAQDEKGHNRFAWSVRKPGMENASIYPWNWEDIIDKHASAEAFKSRLTGTCTYLVGENVMPRHALAYDEFAVLNELNGMYYVEKDGDTKRRFRTDIRKRMMEELFQTHDSVSYRLITNWLKREYGWNGITVGGAQGKTGCESKLVTFRFFQKQVLGTEHLIGGADIRMMDDIVTMSAVYSDKGILHDLIDEKYGDILNEEQIRVICHTNKLVGWGKLSRRFLTGIKVPVPRDGRYVSILDVMRDGNPFSRNDAPMTLNEVLRDDRLGFSAAIAEANEEYASAGIDLIDTMPGSPKSKKVLRETRRVVAELVHIAGCPPEAIAIETTHDDDKKRGQGKRTNSRYDMVRQAVDACIGELDDAGMLHDELGNLGQANWDDEKLMLYFLQAGRSMYSGKRFDISHLSDYQVDHIIPQMYVKDDSLDNKVLVIAGENQRKAANLLVPGDVRQRMMPYWRKLLGLGMLTERKFDRLRRSEIGDRSLKGFIARQLVDTSIVAKYAKLLLEQAYPETRILPTKAGLSSGIRAMAGIPKCREVNDDHHAVDALLASEVARFVEVMHPDMYDNPAKYAAELKAFAQRQAEYEQRTGRKARSHSSYVVAEFGSEQAVNHETGEVWEGRVVCDRLRRYASFKNIAKSVKPFIKGGAFWDSQPLPATSRGGKKSVPRKKNMPVETYGGYSTVNNAYFVLYAGTDKKGKRQGHIVGIPVYLVDRTRQDRNVIQGIVQNDAEMNNLSHPVIRRYRLPLQSTIVSNGALYYVTGTKTLMNAIPVVFSQRGMKALSMMSHGQHVNAEDVAYAYKELMECVNGLGNKYAGTLDILKKGIDKFDALDASQQWSVVRNVLSYLNGKGRAEVDMQLIGGKARGGQIAATSVYKDIEHASIMDISPTGLIRHQFQL